jgi:hypothetical protein
MINLVSQYNHNHSRDIKCKDIKKNKNGKSCRN